MGKDVKKDILAALKKAEGDKGNISLPSESLRFIEQENKTLWIEFTDCKYIIGYDYEDKEGKNVHKNYNMQDSGVCFEGWAVIIKTYCDYDKIVLDVKNVKDEKGLYENWIEKRNGLDAKNGHVGRFFYRALRFCEQYEWFSLSKELEMEVKLFEDYISQEKKFWNNIPKGKAGKSEAEEKAENDIEDQLAKADTLYKALLNRKGLEFDKNDAVYRQLPVGLFEDEVKTKNTVFTGGKSAIDLWTCHDDILYLIELKYNNKMVGIITEIFFYSNYMWDLIRDNGGFEISKPGNRKEEEEAGLRGYDKIQRGKYKQIKGVLLADEGFYHPLVTEQVIETLNGNKKELAPIEYVRAAYEVDENRKVIPAKQNK